LAAVLLQPIEQHNPCHKPQQDQPIHRFADQSIDQGAAQQKEVGGLQEIHGFRPGTPGLAMKITP
jgi:hypothetical protein